MESDTTKSVEPAASLKLLTFNVGLFEFALAGFPIIKPADFIDLRRAQLPAAILSIDADIVAAQEFYATPEEWTAFFNALKDKYPHWVRAPRPTLRVESGLMILSKRPILKSGYKPAAMRGPIDERSFIEKGILWASIDLGGGSSVGLVNIHLTAGGFTRKQDDPKVNEMRKRQIAEAKEVGEENMPEGALIVGDFNAGPEIAKANYDQLIEQGYVDAYVKACVDKPDCLNITWDAENFLNQKGTHPDSISQRIDHIYLPPALQSMLIPTLGRIVLSETNIAAGERKVSVSDHYGTLVEFRVLPPGQR